VYYAAEGLGIPSIVAECASDSTVKVIDGIRRITEERPTKDTIAIGAEILGNMLLESYKQYALDVKTAKKYSTIAEALAGGNEAADGTVIAYDTGSMLNIVLTEDMTASEIIDVTKDCTIHLNGHKLSFATGKHFYLTSGKMTINGAVEGSEVAKAIENGTAENLVSVDGVEGTELHLFGGVYSVTGTATSAIIPIRAGSGKVAKITMSGCAVNMMDCSGLAVYAIQSYDHITIDNCTFDVQVDTCTNYKITALTAPAKNSTTAVRNSTFTINGGNDVIGANAMVLSSQDSIVENCTILASVDKDGAECQGISAGMTGMCLTVNDCTVEANGNSTANAYAIASVASTATEVRINGGHYKGSAKALNLLSTTYINGEEVDGTTYTAKEYDF
jgi:hypothetical protein